jgi:hypothetical protein
VISRGNEKVSGNVLAFNEAKTVPVSAATAAPKLNAISLRRLIGIPIASAARESSRRERQARPVRDWLTKCSATYTIAKKASAT